MREGKSAVPVASLRTEALNAMCRIEDAFSTGTPLCVLPLHTQPEPETHGESYKRGHLWLGRNLKDHDSVFRISFQDPKQHSSWSLWVNASLSRSLIDA